MIDLYLLYEQASPACQAVIPELWWDHCYGMLCILQQFCGHSEHNVIIVWETLSRNGKNRSAAIKQNGVEYIACGCCSRGWVPSRIWRVVLDRYMCIGWHITVSSITVSVSKNVDIFSRLCEKTFCNILHIFIGWFTVYSIEPYSLK